MAVHAGEAAGPESVWQAVKELRAVRIGHGVKTIEDPKLMDYLVEKEIGIESCLTSNIQTSTCSSLAEHPLKKFLQHNILATINSDDPGVQGIDLPYEYEKAAPAAGLSREEIRKCQQNGLKIAFLSESDKKLLRDKVAQNA